MWGAEKYLVFGKVFCCCIGIALSVKTSYIMPGRQVYHGTTAPDVYICLPCFSGEDYDLPSLQPGQSVLMNLGRRRNIHRLRQTSSAPSPVRPRTFSQALCSAANFHTRRTSPSNQSPLMDVKSLYDVYMYLAYPYHAVLP